MIRLLCLMMCISAFAEPYSPFPKYRSKAWPNNDRVHINPPQLLWPADGKFSTYQVELSQSQDFTKNTIVSTKLAYACFTPHKALAKGQWFWRLKHEDGKLTGPFSFQINDQEIYETPLFTEFQQNIPAGHPRFLSSPSGIELAKSKLAGTSLEKELLSKANEFLLAKIPDPKSMDIKEQGLKKHELKRLMINKAKGYLGRRMMQSSYLSAAYLLTGKKEYADKAIENALFVAQLDSKYQHLNDFTESMCLSTLIMVFDNCFDRIDLQEKQKLLSKIDEFTKKYYESMVNNLETRIFDNHAWQKTLNTLFKSALITKGHLTDADKWLEYCYEVWSCRAPASGFNLDGAWVNGSGYFTANIVTLMQMPTIMNRYSSGNFFAHPWFKNAPHALLMTWPANSYSSGFGDGHGSPTNPRWKQAMLIKALASANRDGEATWFYEQMQKDPRCNKELHAKTNTKHPLDSEFIEWFSVAENNELPAAWVPQNLRAANFPTSGFVSMHSDYQSVNNNVFVAFRSSLYGSGSHTSCDQNGFNIIAGGEPLFLGAGHYTNFSDRHNLLQYRHTRGANSILAANQGQSIGTHSYGEILHFEDNESFSYAVGDASSAYKGIITDPMWHKKMKEAGVEASAENGYGDAGVRKFVRHLMYLKPGLILVYDELESKEPINWTWMLHSPKEMLLHQDGVEASNGKFSAKVKLFNTSTITEEMKTQFYEPALNWSKRKINGKIVEYNDQWHYEVKTDKVKKTAFLAVIQISKDAKNFSDLAHENGQVKFGQWRVEVDLKNHKGLKVFKDGAFVAGTKQINEQMIAGAK